jgi:uncharacterized protein (TIGR03435 family)
MWWGYTFDMVLCAALILLTPFFAAAQTAATNLPEFEAASVKPVPLGTPYGGIVGGPGSSSPGQVHYDAATLRAVISRAYGVQRFQIVGPRWFDDERFDIIAKIPPGTTMPQFQLMLQRLLADRFHLEMHKEERSLSVYEMTVAKSGLKMRPVPLPATPPVPPGGAAPAPSSGLRWGSTGEKIELSGRSVIMRQLLVWLSEQTNREIVDKTGLTEAYDFDMSWAPSSAGPDDPLVADILDSAIEKYLGLKVLARKAPVTMVVIDKLERVPVEN